jgi:hypothetical protein
MGCNLARLFPRLAGQSIVGIVVPTERFQIIPVRNTRDPQAKLYFLMFNHTLRRVRDYCTSGRGWERPGWICPLRIITKTKELGCLAVAGLVTDSVVTLLLREDWHD